MAHDLPTRRQLTLFVPPQTGRQLEAARRLLDPVQAGLIAAHVTLCREDEVAGVDASVWRSRLATSEAGPLSLGFGPPESFHAHGILLPCVTGVEAFHALRRALLGVSAVRRQAPHITLAHPRNPKATGNSLGAAMPLAVGTAITFTSVSLIEQEGASPWHVLARFTLEPGVCPA